MLSQAQVEESRTVPEGMALFWKMNAAALQALLDVIKDRRNENTHKS